MTEPDQRPPLDYATPEDPSAVQQVQRFGRGAVGAWFLIFIPVFIGGIGGGQIAWIGVGLVAVACGAYGLFIRRRNPILSAGVMTGTLIGLLHAGWCYRSM